MRKNVASQNVAAQMNSRTDGSPLTTAASVFVTVDGGTQGAGGGTLTHEGNGAWNYVPTQAETNGNHVAFTFVHATGVNQTVNAYPVAFDPSDAVGLGLSRLDAAVTTRASQASLDVVDDFLDTEIAAILAAVDTEIANIQSRLPAALVSGRMDASVGAYPGNTAQTGDAFARLGAPVGASMSADVAAVQADTDNLQTRVPAALVGGRMDSSVGAMAAAVLTATAIAADAITDAKVAADVTIASVTGAVGSVTGAVGSVTGLTPATVHADLDDIQAKIGTPAGVSVSADIAAIEAQTDDIGVAGAGLTALGDVRMANLDATISSRASQASLNTVDDFLDTEIAAILAAVDTEIANLQSRLPAALVGGRMDSSVGAMANAVITALAFAVDAIDAAALKTDAGQEIADRVLARNVAGGSDTGRTVKEAVQAMRNRVAISGATLTVYGVDDVTPLWTATITTAAGNPLTDVDPA